MKKSRELKVSGYLTLKKMFRILKFTAFCLLFTVTQVIGSQNTESESEVLTQQKVVSGIVTDSSGSSLPGVSVVVKGTTIGVITDMEGKYMLSKLSENATLVFSFVGMKTQEHLIGNITTINVVLLEDAIGIEEVVTIGYSTRKKGEITGSVVSLNGDKLNGTPQVNLINALQGKVPGVTINDKGGEPGSPNTVLLVRGKSTLGDNTPLIVIDGVPRDNLNFISPEDIASLTVLKDASAAIYGARAANGVILVETKKGKKGETKLSFTGNYMLSRFTRLEKPMSSYQFTQYMNEIDKYAGRIPTYTSEDIEKYNAGNDPINYPNTNWPKVAMKDWSPSQQYEVSATGGSDKVNYYVSGGILDQGGMFISNDANYKQYQLRSNVDMQLNKYLHLGVDIYGSIGDKNRPASPLDDIYLRMRSQNNPTMVAVYPNGLMGVGAENGNNVLALSSKMSGTETNERKLMQSKISIDLDLSWLTQGLTLNGYASYDFNSDLSKIFRSTWTVYNYNKTANEYVKVPGFSINNGNIRSINESFTTNNNSLYNLRLMYKRTFGDHSFNGFIAYEQSEGIYKFFSAYRKNYLSDKIQELFAGGSEGMNNNGGSSEFGRVNYFGSLGYNYKNKYLLDFTIRRDGSFNFPKGKRFGTFPAVSAAWRLTDEEFMNDISWLSEFKLRGSWALMGNDRVASYQYLTQYSYGGNQGVYNYDRNWYAFGVSPTQVNTFIKSQTPNPNITWETSQMANIGFEASILKDKLTATFDYFTAKRRDILIKRTASIPDYAALSLPDENLGIVYNSGYEFMVNYADRKGDFHYNVGFNIGYSRNKVVFLDEPATVFEYQKKEGFSSGSYLLYKTDGIFNTQEEINSTAAVLKGTQPGDIKYIDVNKDGQITGDDMYRRYSSNVPDYQGALNFDLSYKRFGLNVLFAGQAGHVENFYNFFQGVPFHLFKYEGRWTADNPEANLVRAMSGSDPINTRVSDYWLRNSSFVRLKNLELSYTIPSVWKLSQMRFYVTGSNLWTMDYVKISDPEGLDYPPLTTIMFGLSLKF